VVGEGVMVEDKEVMEVVAMTTTQWTTT